MKVVRLEDPDEEQILNARLAGTPARLVAKQFGCTQARVDQVVDKLVSQVDARYRSRVFALECERLELLSRTYFKPALEGDTNAALIWCKLGVYRASLLGLNAPLRSEVEVIEQRGGPERPVGLAKLELAFRQIAPKKPSEPEDDDAED
jgi:hypothetical protein